MSKGKSTDQTLSELEEIGRWTRLLQKVVKNLYEINPKIYGKCFDDEMREEAEKLNALLELKGLVNETYGIG